MCFVDLVVSFVHPLQARVQYDKINRVVVVGRLTNNRGRTSIQNEKRYGVNIYIKRLARKKMISIVER